MHLIELFLPLTDNEGRSFPRTHYEAIERELTERFGGVTAYPRAPARGLWKPDGGSAEGENVQRDDLVIYEVMAESLDRAWWMAYRGQLETVFRQDKLLIRAQRVDVL